MEAVIFDLDGTLLDTLEDLADSMNAVLLDRGFPTHPLEAYRYFVGEGVEKLVCRALPDAMATDEFVLTCVEAMEAEYGRRWANKTMAYPGIPPLLDTLTNLEIPMAVLSNKPEKFTRLAVSEFLKRWPFYSVSGARPDLPKKPDPSGALAIAADLAVETHRCLYLGDTATDMRTATRAGMYAVGATWGFRPRDELLAAGARSLADDPLDILEFFDRTA